MATNTGDGHRIGSVRDRTQMQRPDGDWQKRDRKSGELMDAKDGGKPFKGVAREPDKRQDK